MYFLIISCANDSAFVALQTNSDLNRLQWVHTLHLAAQVIILFLSLSSCLDDLKLNIMRKVFIYNSKTNALFGVQGMV